MSDRRFSIRLTDGREFGPAAMDVLMQWAREGRVPAEARLVPADGSEARQVTAAPALAAIVMAPPTVVTGLGSMTTLRRGELVFLTIPGIRQSERSSFDRVFRT